MCGLAGFTGPPLPDALRAMCGALVHRGPDDAGYFESPSLSLGLRHLAVADIGDGQQPVSGEAGRVTAIMDGRIFNHQTLRRTLVEAGHRFRTDHADSEICPHAFEEWGVSWPTRANGMFAAALWDDQEKALYLYRDRLGKKPL